MPVISPRVRVMYAVRGRLEDDVDLATLSGVADLKIRWARNRYATAEERPCLSIAFVSDEPADDGTVPASADDLVRVLALDLVVDMEIETEASAEDNQSMGTPLEEYDPAGLDKLSAVLDVAMKALREVLIGDLPETTDLGRKVDWIQDAGIDDDEDLQDEDGRLVGRVNVVYRTSSWDPTVLLER